MSLVLLCQGKKCNIYIYSKDENKILFKIIIKQLTSTTGMISAWTFCNVGHYLFEKSDISLQIITVKICILRKE